MNPNKLQTNLDWALYYRSIGWSPIPVENKKPLIEWIKYQIEIASEETIREWWTKNPNAGIGIVTGKISNIIAVDIEKGGKLEGLLPTVCSKTGGGGFHYIYKYPNKKISNSVKKVAELVDIRGDGGYIVVPPSSHKSGNNYEWLVGPDEASPEEIPLWLLQKITLKNTDKSNWDKIIKSEVSEGSRNSTATQIAGKLLFHLPVDFFEEVGWNHIQQWNKNFAKPPLDQTELRKIWDSIKARELLRRQEKEKFKENFKKEKALKILEIAKFLVEKYKIKTIGERIRDPYIYNDGIYSIGLNEIKFNIENILEELSAIHIINEIIEKIKNITLANRKDFNTTDPDYVNLNNGVLKISTLELLKHDSNYCFLNKIPVDYNSKIDCPKIKKFMSEVLEDKDIPIIQEWLGFCLYRKYFIKKAIIFVGEANTGKTTLLRVFEKFIDKENISGISLQNLSSDKFSVAHLYTKYLNIYDDLKFRDVNDNGAFKMVTGNGLITGEYKFGNQFQFENYSKLTFSCNKIPNVTDTDDEAYFNRWIVIQFNKRVHKINNFLIEEITTKEEMSGLLNFAIEGLRRILKAGRFSYEKSADEIKNEMLRSGSPIANFVYDHLENSQDDWISKEELYQTYVDFTQMNNFPRETKIGFGKKIQKYAPYIMDGKKTFKDTQDTGWRNIRIKRSENKSSEDMSDSDWDSNSP